jgi:phage-related protein
MAFWGKTFIYDGVDSSYYDLKIVNFDTGTKDSDAGSTSEPQLKWIRRRTRAFSYGSIQNQSVSIEMTIGREDIIYGDDRNLIESWLLRKKFLPLQIMQDDLSYVVFNVQFTKAENKYIGNLQRGMTLHGVADSPFGFTSPKTYTKTFTSGGIENYSWNLFIDSADVDDYIYPSMVFVTNGLGTSFQLINSSDDNRTFLFTGLQSNEIMTVDNDLKLLSSNTGLLRSTNFIGKNWFRLKSGVNALNVQGGISSLSITYSLPRKVGA